MVIKSLTFTITLNHELLSFSPSWETEARNACWNEQLLANQVIPCRTGPNSYVDGCKCLQAFLIKMYYIFMYVCTLFMGVMCSVFKQYIKYLYIKYKIL